MKPLARLLDRARAVCPVIVLPEGADPRIAAGAARAQADGLARPLLLGDPARVAAALREAGHDPARLDLLDPRAAPQGADYAAAYLALRRHKGADEAEAARAMADPMGFAAMMVARGEAAGTLGGAVATTAETVRTALRIIGRAEGVTTVSSFFLMLLCQPHHTTKGAVIFADCGLVVEPDARELAAIAIASADSFRAMTGGEPRVAMLSFSTGGSAQHARTRQVIEATERVRAARPEILIHGELQFDAAFVPEIGAVKAKDSPLEGRANVLVFPNLDAANIGYKIAQRIGGAEAIGPVLQGLRRPANDLSRGCSADDVYHMIAGTAVQAEAAAEAPAVPAEPGPPG